MKQYINKVSLDYNSTVTWKDKQWVVVGKRMYQSRWMRPECWSMYYHLSPVEMEGMEHDDEIWVSGVDLQAHATGELNETVGVYTK